MQAKMRNITGHWDSNSGSFAAFLLRESGINVTLLFGLQNYVCFVLILCFRSRFNFRHALDKVCRRTFCVGILQNSAIREFCSSSASLSWPHKCFYWLHVRFDWSICLAYWQTTIICIHLSCLNRRMSSHPASTLADEVLCGAIIPVLQLFLIFSTHDLSIWQVYCL